MLARGGPLGRIQFVQREIVDYSFFIDVTAARPKLCGTIAGVKLRVYIRPMQPQIHFLARFGDSDPLQH